MDPIATELADLAAYAPRPADEFARRHACPDIDACHWLKKPNGVNWSRASKLNLTPSMTAGESFRVIVLESMSHLSANHDCARFRLHVEGVHQCRIALRRLRSAFKIYKPLLRRERIAALEDEVRRLGRILGAARDLDVLSELLEPAIQELGGPERLAPLIASLEAQKDNAYKAVSETFSSAHYHALLAGLRELGHTEELSGAGHQQVARLAANALSVAHRKLLKRGCNFETLSDTERHQVRIALKRLRYTLDFFASVFSQKLQKSFFKRVARLQDDLGRMNDLAVAHTTLTQVAGVARESATLATEQRELVFAAGVILGWYRRGLTEDHSRLTKDWHSFIRAKPFWLQ